MKQPIIKKLTIVDHAIDVAALKTAKVWDKTIEEKVKSHVPDKLITLTLENAYLSANSIRVAAHDNIAGAALDISDISITSTDQYIGVWSIYNIPHIPLGPECPVGTKFAIKVKSGNARIKVTSKYLRNISDNGFNNWCKDFYICHLEANHSLEITGITVSHGTGVDHVKYTQIRGPIPFRMIDYTNVYYLNRLGFIEQNRRIIETRIIMKEVGSKLDFESALVRRILISHKDWEKRMHTVDKKTFASMDHVVYFNKLNRTDKHDEVVTKLFRTSVNRMPQDYRMSFQVNSVTDPKMFMLSIFKSLEDRFAAIVTALQQNNKNKVLEIKTTGNMYKYEVFGENHVVSNLVRYGIYQSAKTIEQLNTNYCFRSPDQKFAITIGHSSARKLMLDVCTTWKKYFADLGKQAQKLMK